MAEWWRRAQWAMEASASTNDRMYSYGTAVLGVLAKNNQAGREEKELFDAAWRGSFTKMQDQEIEKLIEIYLVAGQPTANGPRIAHPPLPEPGSERLGAANQPPGHGDNGIMAGGDPNIYSGAPDPGRGPWVFRTVRREILAARLKVILDEQLDRYTSPMVQYLAQMGLPAIAPSHLSSSDASISADPPPGERNSWKRPVSG